MNLNYEIKEEDDTVTVFLAGEIDAYTAPDLKGILLPYTKSFKNIQVDLEQVNYMDSTGLGVFISALKSTKEQESHLKLLNLQERVHRLFEITGLTDIIPIDSSIRGGM